MCCVNVISLSVILSKIERVLMFVYMYCVSYVWMIYLFNCYRTKKNYITSKSIIVTGNSVLFIYLPGNKWRPRNPDPNFPPDDVTFKSKVLPRKEPLPKVKVHMRTDDIR